MGSLSWMTDSSAPRLDALHETQNETKFRHMPTPSASHPNSPESPDDPNLLVSISTTFFATAQLDTLPPDVILLSADSVFFSVHSRKLQAASENGFDGLLPAQTTYSPTDTGSILYLSENAVVVNLTLHVIYGLPCAHYAPDLDQLTETLHALSRYGIPGPSAVGQGTPLADALLALAATHPVDVYALAAQHGLHDLVVRVSAHVLCISLATVSDAQADAMGALYLKRLFFLHLGRADAFKRLLLVPPAEHLPTVVCGVGERAKLTRAWALASAYLSWDGRPDVPPSTIEATVRPLSIGIECERCRTALATRLQTLILQWSLVKRTI